MITSMDGNKLQQKWGKCMDFIRDNVTQAIYQTWFAEIKPLRYADDKLIIQVSSPFVYEYLEANYLDLLKMAITRNFGDDTKLMYSVITDKETTSKRNTSPSITRPPDTRNQRVSATRARLYLRLLRYRIWIQC